MTIALDVAHDPVDTVRWMLEESVREVGRNTVTDGSGRTRPKSKVRRAQDEARVDLLCEVLWNISGRRRPLDELRTEALAA
jgi:hypothetical protein